MLTENWPLARDPAWPPRWDQVSSGTKPPLFVYLDQWCYDHLARDRAGQPMHADEAGTYATLRKMALDGAVVIVLSEAHYRENWKRDHPDGRWDTAVVMGELTGFHTLRTRDLDLWDALVGAAAFLGVDLDPGMPAVVGWGLKHCLTGQSGQAFILDTMTGTEAQWDSDLPEPIRQSLEELEAAVPYRLELAMLALRDPRLEPAFAPVTPIRDSRGQRFARQERDIKAAIDRHGRTPRVIRNAVEFAALKDSLALLDRASASLGHSPNAIAEAVVDAGSPAMSRLLSGLPIQGVFTELRVQKQLKGDARWQDSDLLDFLALATALPVVDFYVADRRAFNLAADARLDSWGGGQVMRSLRTLCDLLKARV